MNKLASFLYILAIIVIVFCAIYSFLWLKTSSLIKNEIIEYAQHIEENDNEVFIRDLKVSGFPYAHRTTFSAQVQNEYVTLDIPQIVVHGFLLGGQDIDISAPQGVAIIKPEDKLGIYKLDAVSINFTLPDDIPHKFSQAEMTKWQKHDNVININGIYAESNGLKLFSKGEVHLDNNLQPVANLGVVIRDYQEYLGRLRAAGVLNKGTIAMATAIMALISTIDPETGKTYLQTTISLRDRTLQLGPAQIGEIPEITWEKD